MTDSERAVRLSQLLEAGKQSGYILFDDVNALLPEDCESGRELDDLLAAIERAGVEMLVEATSDAGDESETTRDAIGRGIYTEDPVQVYLALVWRVPLLTPDAEMELAKGIRRGDKDRESAKKDLVEANLRQVVVIARHYADRGVHILDLFEQGNRGLMKAADNFDYTRGYRFRTYAGWLARRAIIRAVQR